MIPSFVGSLVRGPGSKMNAFTCSLLQDTEKTVNRKPEYFIHTYTNIAKSLGHYNLSPLKYGYQIQSPYFTMRLSNVPIENRQNAPTVNNFCQFQNFNGKF